jgi:hypothetical protein
VTANDNNLFDAAKSDTFMEDYARVSDVLVWCQENFAGIDENPLWQSLHTHLLDQYEAYDSRDAEMNRPRMTWAGWDA